jgi:hypothetical protein
MTLIQNTDPIRTVSCETAEDLLSALRRISYSYENGPPHGDQWAWRGQANAAWELIPSVFRPDTLIGYITPQHVHAANPKEPNSVSQHRAEFYALYNFVLLADELGLEVPGDSQIFRNQSVYVDVIECVLGTPQWPQPDILEVMAIAQHHGVPTRLIDFTSKALIAAYFAATNYIDSKDTNPAQRIAIWGVNRDFLYMASMVNPQDSITTVTVPRAHNKNLHEQHGFFLMDNRAGFDNKPVELNRTVEIIARNAWVTGKLSTDWLPMVKLTAPVTIIPELLALLAVESIDRAHLMPSFNEVVRELERRRARLWVLKDKAADPTQS